MTAKKPKRADRVGQHNTTFLKNRKRILASCNVCALCGRIVDKTLPPSDPMSAEIDHIIPVSRGGALSAMSNLQLTHRICNRKKSNKMKLDTNVEAKSEIVWSMDWTEYRSAKA